MHNSIPLLVVIANNRSFFNDELHQERVARDRGRPVENRWIGQSIRDPDIDLATLARGQGCLGIGPVEDPKKLVAAMTEAVAAVARRQGLRRRRPRRGRLRPRRRRRHHASANRRRYRIAICRTSSE